MDTSFSYQVIKIVHANELLWNKYHYDYNNRGLQDKEWNRISKILKKDKNFIKQRWRNLRDHFTRELRKFSQLPSGETGPYQGRWEYFAALTFLKDVTSKRTSNAMSSWQDSSFKVDGIEGEWNLPVKQQECSDGEDDEQDNELEEPEFLQEESEIVNAFTEYSSHNKSIKRKHSPTVEQELESDDDMHFVKSLVPYLKKLKPVRKLVVRSRIQNLLVKELLCGNCRVNGQQENCSCADL